MCGKYLGGFSPILWFGEITYEFAAPFGILTNLGFFVKITWPTASGGPNTMSCYLSRIPRISRFGGIWPPKWGFWTPFWGVLELQIDRFGAPKSQKSHFFGGFWTPKICFEVVGVSPQNNKNTPLQLRVFFLGFFRLWNFIKIWWYIEFLSNETRSIEIFL